MLHFWDETKHSMTESLMPWSRMERDFGHIHLDISNVLAMRYSNLHPSHSIHALVHAYVRMHVNRPPRILLKSCAKAVEEGEKEKKIETRVRNVNTFSFYLMHTFIPRRLYIRLILLASNGDHDDVTKSIFHIILMIYIGKYLLSI